MTEETNNIEITKARSRVTANTPAFYQNPPASKTEELILHTLFKYS